jgi:hypothetical protein
LKVVAIVGINARVAKTTGEIELKSAIDSGRQWQMAEVAAAVVVVAVMVMMVEVVVTAVVAVVVAAVVAALVQQSWIETERLGWWLEGKGEDPMGVMGGSPSTKLWINNRL